MRIYVFEAKRQSLSGTAGSQSLKLSSKPEKVRLRLEGYIDSKKIELMVLKVFRFVYWAGNKTFCFSHWNGNGMFAFGCWAEKVHVKIV